MPTYTYECCNKQWERYHYIKDRYNEWCSECKKRARIVILAPHAQIWKPYLDDIIGSQPVYFETRRQKEEYMKRHGIRIAEKGEKMRSSPERVSHDGITIQKFDESLLKKKVSV